MITGKRGVSTAETHRATRTPALEWDVNPEGEREVELVCNATKRPPLRVSAHLCAKYLANPTWRATKMAANGCRRRIYPIGATFWPKTLWVYSKSAQTTYNSPH